ncbi:MAG TPA: hypothetical protein VIE66_11710 [Methylocella sp.]
MNVQALIKEAANCGVRVNLKGDRLALNAVTKPSASLLAKLQQHKTEIVALLRQEIGFTRPEPDEAELGERKGVAAGSVPEPYLDAWVRLQCQKPMRVPDAEVRRALNDTGRFLDQWGTLAVEFQWTPADLFDVPRDGRPGGLVWFLQDETVRALGPEHVVTEGERIFDRVTRADWINQYQKGKHR